MLVSYILQNARNKYEGALYCLEYVCSNGQTDVYCCQAKSGHGIRDREREHGTEATHLRA